MTRKESEEKLISRPRPLPLEPLVPQDGKSRTQSADTEDHPLCEREASDPGQRRKGFSPMAMWGSKGSETKANAAFGLHSRQSFDSRRSSEGGHKPGTPYPTQGEQKQLFIDANAMKAKVRQNLMKKRYAVTDYYKETGIFQAIVRSSKFENATLSIIALNAIWIAIDTDYNDSEVLLDAHAIFQMAENLFCAYFSFEWVARYCSFRSKRDCLKDAWFVFDSLLVLTMVLETWVMTFVMVMSGGGGGGGMGNASILRIARLLRLSRMARMARLLRAMPELMVLIKGMLAATRSVFFTLCLLILIMYVFAIAFTQLTANTNVGNNHFKSVSASMYTLLVHGALLDDVSGISNKLGRDSFLFAAVFFVFSLLAALTVMNMLIGVLCEVVSAVAATEKEEMMVTYVHEKLKQVLSLLDTDGDQMISKHEFVEVVLNFEAARALQEVGVDVVGLIDFADFIFVDYDDNGMETESDLSFERFMEVILQLRGTNNATVKDIVDMRKILQRAMAQSTGKLASIEKQLSLLTTSAGLSYNSSDDAFDSRKSYAGIKGPVVPDAVTQLFHQPTDLHDNLFGMQPKVQSLNSEKSNTHPSKAPVASSKGTAIRFDIEAVQGNAHELPIHIVSTPSAMLFQSVSSSLEVEAAARDILNEGQWDSLLGSNLSPDDQSTYVNASSRSSPIRPSKNRSEGDKTNYPSTSRLEQGGATTIYNVCDTSSMASGSDEVGSLRGQIAKLGSVLQSGINEYQKLQDWVVQEHASDVGAQGMSLQLHTLPTIAAKPSAALEKARHV